MRFVGWILVIVIMGAAPVAAQQQAHRGQCLKLTKQIARYERDAGWARERGNALWEQANLNKVEELSDRRGRLCPEFRDPDYAAQFAALFDAATRLATRYFFSGF